jgi:hypothetical protein
MVLAYRLWSGFVQKSAKSAIGPQGSAAEPTVRCGEEPVSERGTGPRAARRDPESEWRTAHGMTPGGDTGLQFVQGERSVPALRNLHQR